MFIGPKVSDFQTQPSWWSPTEREMSTITTSQVARDDVEVWDNKIDGAVLWLKSDIFQQVLDIADYNDSLLLMASFGYAKSVKCG